MGTQGWNQGDYGQYYLYQNALDTDVTVPDVTSDDDDLLALALLSGVGTKKYYPNQGYPAYPPSFRRKRRHAEDTENVFDETENEETFECVGNACVDETENENEETFECV